MSQFFNLGNVDTIAERNALNAQAGMIVTVGEGPTYVYKQGTWREIDESGKSKYATVTATLVNGVAVVPTSTITSTGRATVTYDTVLGVPGALYVAGSEIDPLVSFTIRSTSLGDNSVVTATYNTAN